MQPITLILNLYLAAHAVYWFMQETNRSSNSSAYAFLSRICDPFCRLLRNVELRISGKNASFAVPVLTLAMIRLFLSALS